MTCGSPPRKTKMSAPLIVSIPHRLGREEATRRLKAGLTRAASTIPVLQVDEERWEQDRMDFRVRALGQTITSGSKSRCPGYCNDLRKQPKPRSEIAATCC